MQGSVYSLALLLLCGTLQPAWAQQASDDIIAGPAQDEQVQQGLVNGVPSAAPEPSPDDGVSPPPEAAPADDATVAEPAPNGQPSAADDTTVIVPDAPDQTPGADAAQPSPDISQPPPPEGAEPPA